MISSETRTEYCYTTKKGVTVTVSGVPVSIVREEHGEEHQVFSRAVAIRLEELIKRVKNSDAVSDSFFKLEF
jgi:DNA primase